MPRSRSRHPLAGILALLAVVAGCTPDARTAAPSHALPDLLSPTVDGSSGNAAVVKLCQKNGWMQLTRSDGTAFLGEGDCVSYAALGGRLGQAITFTSANPSPVEIGASSYAPHAVATSGLPVALTLDAASSGCQLVNGVVSFTSAGTCLVDANQPGDNVWAAAPQAQQAITVNRKHQTVSFSSTNPSPVHVGYPDYTPQATATSGLAVTFNLDPASSGCTLQSGVVHYTAAGRCIIDANQAGNSVWAPAPQVQQAITVTVNPAQYCASIGGTYGGQTSTALWTCNGWPAASVEDARIKVDPLVDACRVDNGLTTGPLDFGTNEPYPTTVNARCHLPPS